MFNRWATSSSFSTCLHLVVIHHTICYLRGTSKWDLFLPTRITPKSVIYSDVYCVACPKA